MKRSIIQKAGTLFLSTAAGCCFLSADAALGQNATSSGNEIQRRLQEIYAREGNHQPASALKKTAAARPAANAIVPVANSPLVPLEPPRPAIREVASAPLPEDPKRAAEQTPELPVITPSTPKKGLLGGLHSTSQQPTSSAVPPSHFPGHRAAEQAASEPFRPFEADESPASQPLPRTNRPEVKSAGTLPAITPGPSANPKFAQVPGAKPRHPQALPTPLPHSSEAPRPATESKSRPLSASVASARGNFEMPILSGSTESQAAATANVEFTPAFPASDESREQAGATALEIEEQTATAPPFANPEPTAGLPLVTSRATASNQARQALVESPSSKPAAIPIERPAAAHIGLNGCCPVTLRNDRMQIPGRPELASQWQGAVYHFASSQAKQNFDAHPEVYAPAHAGLDVTQASIQGQQRPGSLEHAVWYRRQLYLFHDAAAMKNFTANPEYYAHRH